MRERKFDIITIQNTSTKDEILESANSISNNAIADFDEYINELERIASINDMISPISYFASFGLTRGVSDYGLEKEMMSSIQQSHIELLQAISLKFDRTENNTDYHKNMPKIMDGIIKVQKAFSMMRLNKVLEDSDGDLKLLIEKIRQHTQSIRNWGYLFHEIEILKSFSNLLNDYLQKPLGYSISKTINLFENMLFTSEKRINEYFIKMKSIFRMKNIEELINEYNTVLNENLDYSDFYHEDGSQLSIDDVRAYLFYHSSFMLPDIFHFSIEELSENTNIKSDEIIKIIDDYSLCFGDLKNKKTEYLFLANPVWFNPIIKLDDKNIFCAISSLFFNNFYRKLTNLDSLKSGKIIDKLSKSRSKFLEDCIEELLQKYFPNGKVYKNVKWKFQNTQFETDILLNYYGVLLIIEAKSGSLSEKGLRGEPARIKRHINELIIKPINQADNFIEFIETNLHEGFIETDSHGKIEVSDIFKILKLSISLEDFAAIQSNLNNMKDIPGLHSFTNIVSMNLADFKIVMDLFERPEERIHYILWRNDLLASNFSGNEVDLLGLYLENKFNNYSITESDNYFVFDDLSMRIDDYFESIQNGINVKRPRILNSNYWNKLLTKISDKKFSGWLDIWVIMQSFLYDDQKNIEKKLKRYPKFLAKNRKMKNRKDAIFCINYKNDIVIFLFIFDSDYSERHEISKNYAITAFDEYDADFCYIIGYRIGVKQLPYSFIRKIGRHEP